MTITLAQLHRIMPHAHAKAQLFIEPLNAAMAEFRIHSKLRVCSFLSTIGHESGQFRYVRELASGKAYEGRLDLGNSQPGDGVRFKGRGLIQITGRENYVACMLALDIDCVNHPELLEIPINAVRSAAWWWNAHGCNQLADSGDQVAVCRRVNGGKNGLADRLELYQRACEVLA